MTQLLLPVLAAVLLLGAALAAVMRADRRNESRQQRLQAITAVGPGKDEPGLSLRRATSHATVRELFGLSALSALWMRLDAALAATGGRIGVPHLFAAGLITAAAAVGFGKVVMGFGPFLSFPWARLRASRWPWHSCASRKAAIATDFSTPFPMHST